MVAVLGADPAETCTVVKKTTKPKFWALFTVAPKYYAKVALYLGDGPTLARAYSIAELEKLDALCTDEYEG